MKRLIFWTLLMMFGWSAFAPIDHSIGAAEALNPCSKAHLKKIPPAPVCNTGIQSAWLTLTGVSADDGEILTPVFITGHGQPITLMSQKTVVPNHSRPVIPPAPPAEVLTVDAETAPMVVNGKNNRARITNPSTGLLDFFLSPPAKTNSCKPCEKVR